MRIIIIFIVWLSLGLSVNSQIFTDSNLPIVIITTDIDQNTGQPAEIPDEPKVLANMKVIYRPDGSRNYLTDQNTPGFLNYNGRIAIETRGSTSQMLPKKPYGLTTLKSDNNSNNNVSILGMPKENDWILNSLAFDPTLIRDNLSYILARNMGNYASRGVYCEVIVNGNYRGLYVFMEKLKIDPDRIDILKLTNSDNTEPRVTGGYVIKCDKTTGSDPVAWSMPSYNGSTYFVYDSPDPEDITQQQSNYIYNQFNLFQSRLTAKNESLINGFPAIIDIPSFIDFIIINELTSNVDSYQFSTFFHKDRNGKLRAGPIWDFNLTYGNDLFHLGLDRSHTNVWQFDNGDNTGPKFWKDLHSNATFKCYLTKRWKELSATGKFLNNQVIVSKIDSLVNLIGEAKDREQTRWNSVGNHSANISSMKIWLQNRINWLNSNWSNYQSCSNPAKPQLVISKINYNPAPAEGLASDDLEFIEIVNNSNITVNLTGFYLKKLGLTYQFPPNSVIGPNEKIFLASNSSAFNQFYGFVPFGQFTRNLSNKSYEIVLSDAYGNIIDYVQYYDSLPWPTEADGNGYYLQLININTDNSLATNWIASRSGLSLNTVAFAQSVLLFPNPAGESITVITDLSTLKSFEIFDVAGRFVAKGIDLDVTTVNIDYLPQGSYFIKLDFYNGRSVVKKIIKK